MELIFDKFNKDKELDKQRELFIECFPENIGTTVVKKEHYLWKFHSFPSQSPSFEYVAKSENDILGYYAAIPYPYKVNGKDVNAAMVCDVMTGIKARGKGVFTKLGKFSTNEFKKEGLAFSTGYPIRPEVIPGHKKAGWDFPFEIPMYGQFLKFDSYLKERKKKYLIPFANFILFLINGLISINIGKKKKNINIEHFTSDQLDQINGLECFLNLWQRENKISLKKDINFLKWRLGAPGKKYQILVLRKNENIIGYTIFRKVIKKKVPCLGILDFILLQGESEQNSLLFNEIKKVAKKEGVELILIMMLKKQAKAYRLQKNFFLRTPYKFSFIIKKFDDSLNDSFLFNENNWNLMWIDSDDL